MQTDYIDLYQFHSGTDAMFDTPGLWETLRGFVDAGTVRHLGISVSRKNASIYQVNTASEVGAEAIQVVYNRIERQAENEMLPSCLRQDLGVLATGAAGQRIPERQVHERVRSSPALMCGPSGRVRKSGAPYRAGRTDQKRKSPRACP